MREWVTKNRITTAFILGLGMLFAGFGAWCLFTISYRGRLFEYAGALATIVTAMLYLCMILLAEKNEEIFRQLRKISAAGLLISGILLLSTGGTLFQKQGILFLLIEFLWCLVFGFCAFYHVKRKEKQQIWDSIKENIFSHKWLLLLLLVTGIFLIEPDAVQFKWDGILYYTTCKELTLGSLSNLAIYGHIAQTYGVLVKLMMYLTGNTAAAMTAVNVVLMFFSICAFYGLLKTVMEGRKEWQYALAAAIYGGSPFLLGMVYYHNLDFACQCLFPTVLYCLYKRKWVYFAAASLLFCFTKEPAIVVYGAMCVGVVIIDFMKDQGFSVTGRIKRLFGRKKYYLMVVPGVLWVVVYGLLGPWSAGEGGFAVDWAYVAEKLKVLYVLNFNWIFVLICIVGLILLLCKNKIKKVSFLVPVLCGQIAFTLFSCLFKTVNHPRYNDTNQVSLYLIAIVFSFCCCRDLLRSILHGGAAVLLLVSCFKTIDPVSRFCFPQYQIGDDSMITTMEIPLGDGMIYNRQMLGMERVIDLALKEALGESKTVLFPAVGDNTYFFDGMAEVGSVEGYRKDIEYWNPAAERREAATGEEIIDFEVYHIAEGMDWKIWENEVSGKVNLLYFSFAGEELAETVRQRYTVTGEAEYRYRGWTLTRVEFAVDK